jgi:hypothetical protein
MAYIGKTPVIGNFVKLDSITVVNGQAAYTMQNGGVNFTSYDNVNQFLVSLNGVLQAPTDSFTVSGSTLTFASNLSTGDVIDFVLVLGNSLDIGTPSDNTVTAAKLNNDIISGSTELASEPADTDEFLVSDAGTIKRIDYSLIKGGGITMADHWRVTAQTNQGTNGFVTSNWERNDSTGFGQLGTGLTESSGTFTFPSTGIYKIDFTASFEIESSDTATDLELYITTDNSSYNSAAVARAGNSGSGVVNGTGASHFLFDVTDTSTHKFKFRTGTMGATTYLRGHTDKNHTSFLVVRLGDT